MPAVSIILPTFNRAHLIARAIESVLAQRFTDWELSVIDDGSRDATFDLVRPYALADRRILYHYSQNSGLAAARNAGIRSSRANIVTFLDSDDRYAPEHLALRMGFLAANPAIELLHGGVSVIGPDRVADKHDPARMIPISECVVGGTFFIRRALIERLGGFRDVPYGDDRDFFDRAEATGARVANVEWPTYIYNRLEPDSLCAIVEREGVEGIERYRAGVT